ncbi:uncharacterized protein LOC133568629 [Nerophis ophidion]|uniref:uncharacterized protein LOC133568629 n=1 Tax=Nerophis ophidion TaxID=159077 RepID=UPI002AE05649|nr:uncharacterized protein LOC133568629 [Nerophis ophidion]
MEGEFDREIDDDGWGPVSPYVTLLTQIGSTANALAATSKPTDKEKKVTKAKQKLEQLIQDMGKTLEHIGPLGQLILDKMNTAAVKRDEAEEQGKIAGLLQNSSWRKKERDWKRERREWAELLICWQSTKHLHQKELHSKSVTAPHVPTYPPPYAPPTHGMYPTFYIEKGTLNIDPPGGHVTDKECSSDKISLRSIKSSTPAMVSLPFPPAPPLSAVGKPPQTIVVTESEEAGYTEFMDGQLRERFKEKQERFSQEAERQAAEMKTFLQDQVESAKKQLSGIASLRDIGQWEADKEQDLLIQLDVELNQLDQASREGHDSRHLLTSLLEQNEGTVEEAMGVLDRQREERRQRRELIAPVADLLRKKRAEDPTADTHPYNLRSGWHVASAYPLVPTAQGQVARYKPFSFGDVQAMVDKLPPVTDGGGLWMNKLDTLTAGHTLALGDFRAVAARCMTQTNLRDVETDAKTLTLSDEVRFIQLCTALGAAMRSHFPLPNSAVMPKIRWDPKQNPRQFLCEAKEAWTNQTGQYPGNTGSQAEWFRQAVLSGVPESVQTAMKSNPDMLGCQLCTWEKHLVHHLTTAQDKTQQDEKD